MLGIWALGGAALAAHRGEAERARELWTLGVRRGADVPALFPRECGERLAVALGREEDREPLLATWRERSVAASAAGIRELMDDLVGDGPPEDDPLG